MSGKTRFNKEQFRRGIYILPNLFTSLNMFCGFYAIISAINGKFVSAAVAILIASVFDLLDGKVARATNTQSSFGVEYDSLADLVSFGMAPALMMYLWALQPFGRIGWLAGFLYMACGALRLARFNTMVGKISSDYFQGLPIPAAAGMNAVTILFFNKLNLGVETIPVMVLVMIYILSFLMVSNIKYQSFKNSKFLRKSNFNFHVFVILVLIFIAAQPSIALFLIGFTYIVSGPLFTVRYYKNSKKKDAETRKIEEQRENQI
ncbi:MAG: CDP-diacylglycerol--serine O-phosphatidyltransferase [Desulfobacterales bacterium]|nr:CDP-diacylglycerol--serine O-phosphatidyltransferase [Desulfobacterales bacterium]